MFLENLFHTLNILRSLCRIVSKEVTVEEKYKQSYFKVKWYFDNNIFVRRCLTNWREAYG